MVADQDVDSGLSLKSLGGEESAIVETTSQEISEAMLNQLHSMQKSVNRIKALSTCIKLKELEHSICVEQLSQAHQVQSTLAQRYSNLVDHYSQYVRAFKTTTGEVPRIACVGKGDDYFAVGVELAGCLPIVHADAKSVGALTSQLRISRDNATWAEVDAA